MPFSLLFSHFEGVPHHDELTGQAEAAEDHTHPEHAGRGSGLGYKAEPMDGGVLQKTCDHAHVWNFTSY